MENTIKRVENYEIKEAKEINNGVSESLDIVTTRSHESKEIYDRVRARNKGALNAFINKKEREMIRGSEREIVLSELKSKQQELEAIQTARIKSLQKLMETKLMSLNAALQVELSREFSKNQTILQEMLNQKELEFLVNLEEYDKRIETYKIPSMKERALKSLEEQIDKFFETKLKLIDDFYSLIEQQKFNND